MQTVLRLAPTYALLGAPTGVVARSFPSYILVDQVKVLPKGVSGKQAVFDLIMQRTEEDFDEEDLVLSSPQVFSSEIRNTEVTAYPKPDTGYHGKITFQYNRVNLGDVVLPEDFTVEDEITAHDLLPRLIAGTGIELVKGDLEETLVTEAGVTLIASVGSYFFIPGTSLFIPR